MCSLNGERKNNFKIAICTNLLLSIQLRKVHKLGIGDYIDYILTSEEIGKQKPSKENFLNVLEYLNVTPEEAVFIGDDYKIDIEGAEKIGISGILIGESNCEKCLSFNNFRSVIKHIESKYIEN